MLSVIEKSTAAREAFLEHLNVVRASRESYYKDDYEADIENRDVQ